jgi:hypothetical protein
MDQLVLWLAVLERSFPRAWNCMFYHENAPLGRGSYGKGDVNRYPYNLMTYWDICSRAYYIYGPVGKKS